MPIKPKASESSEAPQKKDAWDDVQHFKPVDFACTCDGLCDHKPRISMDLVGKLDLMHEEIGLPFMILAGTKCKAFNFKCRGTSTSALVPDQNGISHGVDLAIPDDSYRYKVVAAALSVGIKRVVLRRESVHLDDTPGAKESLRVDLARK
jgi:hypothetical protein